LEAFYSLYILSFCFGLPLLLIVKAVQGKWKGQTWARLIGLTSGALVFCITLYYWKLGTPVLLDAEESMRWWFMLINAAFCFGSSILCLEMVAPGYIDSMEKIGHQSAEKKKGKNVSQISIFEDDDVIIIEIIPERVRYEFNTWSEAYDALPNLPEAADKDNRE
jgi:hypothetical protein